MLTLKDYWQGRDATNPLDMSPAIDKNARRQVELVNKLLAFAEQSGVFPHLHPSTGTILSSGWRPPSVNAATKGASRTSMHMTGEACDFYDPDNSIDRWCLSAAGQAAMTAVGIWLEHPDATPGWSHWQQRPPGSGNRVFRP